MKKMFSYLMIALLLVFGLTSCFLIKKNVVVKPEVEDQTPADFFDAEGEYSSRRLIVGYSDYRVADKFAELVGGRVVRNIPEIRAIVIEFSTTIEEKRSRINRVLSINKDIKTDIRYLETDRKRSLVHDETKTPDQEARSTDLTEYQWSFAKMNIYDAFEKGYKGNGVIVALVDTGIDMTHRDIKGNCIGGYNPLSKTELKPNRDYSEGFTHGTEMAGIIAAEDNGEGIIGIAPQANLMNIVVFNEEGYIGDALTSDGIIWAINHGANIIVCSWNSPGYSHALHEAINYGLGRGTVFIMPIGDKGTEEVLYPSAYSGLVNITATYPDDSIYEKANKGRYTTLAAPGAGAIITTIPTWYTSKYIEEGQPYAFVEGTSFAAANAAGASALLMQKIKEASSTPRDALNRGYRLIETLSNSSVDLCENGFDTESGWGLIDVKTAMGESIRDTSLVNLKIKTVDENHQALNGVYITLSPYSNKGASRFGKTNLFGEIEFFGLSAENYLLAVGMNSGNVQEAGDGYTEIMHIDQDMDKTVIVKSFYFKKIPEDKTVVQSESVSFLVEVEGGTTPYEYYWRKNGEIIPGETGPELVFPQTSIEDSGLYSVLVQDSTVPIRNAIISSDIVLTVVNAMAEKWKRPIDVENNLNTNLALYQGKLFLKTDKGELLAIESETGAILWQNVTGNNVFNSPMVFNDTIYSVKGENGSGALSAYKGNGLLRWRYAIPEEGVSSPAAGPENRIGFVTNTGKVVVIDRDGSIVWTYETGKTSHSDLVYGADGSVVFGTNDGMVTCVNSFGTLSWQKLLDSESALSPIIDRDHTMYFVSLSGWLYALYEKGDTKFTIAPNGDKFTTSPVLDDEGNLYVGSEEGRIYRISPSGVSSLLVDLEGKIEVSPVLGADRYLYIGSSNGRMYVVHSETGVMKENGVINLGSPICSSPIIDESGILYTALKNGHVVALYTDCYGMMPSPWYRYKKDAQNTGFGTGASPLTIDASSTNAPLFNGIGILTEGDPFTVSVDVSGGTAPYRYYWSKDNKPISESPTNALTITDTKKTDSGVYSVLVIDALECSIEKPIVTISVVEPLSITKEPIDLVRYLYQSALFLVQFKGGYIGNTGEYSLAWYKDGVALSNTEKIIFATSISEPANVTLEIKDLSYPDHGVYFLEIKDGLNRVIASRHAKLEVVLDPYEPDISFGDVKNGTFRMGSILYSSDEERNRLHDGTKIAFNIYQKNNEKGVLGYIDFKYVFPDYLIFDYGIYNENSTLHSYEENKILRTGEQFDLNKDGEQDIEYNTMEDYMSVLRASGRGEVAVKRSWDEKAVLNFLPLITTEDDADSLTLFHYVDEDEEIGWDGNVNLSPNGEVRVFNERYYRRIDTTQMNKMEIDAFNVFFPGEMPPTGKPATDTYVGYYNYRLPEFSQGDFLIDIQDCVMRELTVVPSTSTQADADILFFKTKIVEVDSSPSPHRANRSEKTLEDVFGVLEINFSGDPRENEIIRLSDGRYALRRELAEREESTSQLFHFFKELYLYGPDKDQNFIKCGASAEASVTLDLEIKTAGILGIDIPKGVRASVDINFTHEASVTAHYSKKDEKDISLLHLEPTFPFMAGPVPLQIGVPINAGVKYAYNVTMDATAGYWINPSFKFSFSAGIGETPKPVLEPRFESGWIGPEYSITGAASLVPYISCGINIGIMSGIVKVGLDAELNCELYAKGEACEYGLAGGELSSPDVKAEAGIIPSLVLNLNIGSSLLKDNWGFDLLNKKIAVWKMDLKVPSNPNNLIIAVSDDNHALDFSWLDDSELETGYEIWGRYEPKSADYKLLEDVPAIGSPEATGGTVEHSLEYATLTTLIRDTDETVFDFYVKSYWYSSQLNRKFYSFINSPIKKAVTSFMTFAETLDPCYTFDWGSHESLRVKINAGIKPLRYTWKKDGETIPASTADSRSTTASASVVSFNPVRLSDAGYYEMQCEDSSGMTLEATTRVVTYKQRNNYPEDSFIRTSDNGFVELYYSFSDIIITKYDFSEIVESTKSLNIQSILSDSNCPAELKGKNFEYLNVEKGIEVIDSALNISAYYLILCLREASANLMDNFYIGLILSKNLDIIEIVHLKSLEHELCFYRLFDFKPVTNGFVACFDSQDIPFPLSSLLVKYNYELEETWSYVSDAQIFDFLEFENEEELLLLKRPYSPLIGPIDLKNVVLLTLKVLNGDEIYPGSQRLDSPNGGYTISGFLGNYASDIYVIIGKSTGEGIAFGIIDKSFWVQKQISYKLPITIVDQKSLLLPGLIVNNQKAYACFRDETEKTNSLVKIDTECATISLFILEDTIIPTETVYPTLRATVSTLEEFGENILMPINKAGWRIVPTYDPE